MVNSVVLFSLFYATIQPIILLFGTLGLIAYYLAMRYLIFNRFSRPR